MTAGIARDEIAHSPVFKIIEDSGDGTAIGFLKLRTEEGNIGYISDIAVHPDLQRKGVGEAALRWALARFRDDGRSLAALTVSTDNGPAIALYRKLGFVAAASGIDYRRPLDNDEVRQILDKNRTEHITVRRRF